MGGRKTTTPAPPVPRGASSGLGERLALLREPVLKGPQIHFHLPGCHQSPQDLLRIRRGTVVSLDERRQLCCDPFPRSRIDLGLLQPFLRGTHGPISSVVRDPFNSTRSRNTRSPSSRARSTSNKGS